MWQAAGWRAGRHGSSLHAVPSLCHASWSHCPVCWAGRAVGSCSWLMWSPGDLAEPHIPGWTWLSSHLTQTYLWQVILGSYQKTVSAADDQQACQQPKFLLTVCWERMLALAFPQQVANARTDDQTRQEHQGYGEDQLSKCDRGRAASLETPRPEGAALSYGCCKISPRTAVPTWEHHEHSFSDMQNGKGKALG